MVDYKMGVEYDFRKIRKSSFGQVSLYTRVLNNNIFIMNLQK